MDINPGETVGSDVMFKRIGSDPGYREIASKNILEYLDLCKRVRYEARRKALDMPAVMSFAYKVPIEADVPRRSCAMAPSSL